MRPSVSEFFSNTLFELAAMWHYLRSGAAVLIIFGVIIGAVLF